MHHHQREPQPYGVKSHMQVLNEIRSPNTNGVLEMWDMGSKLYHNDDVVRLAPFIPLEHPQLRTLWRHRGHHSNMAKPMNLTTNVVHVVHKRVIGLPRRDGDGPHATMPVVEAVLELEGVLETCASLLLHTLYQHGVREPNITHEELSVVRQMWQTTQYEEASFSSPIHLC